MTRRTISKPIGLNQPTYFRIAIKERTTSGALIDRGMHNQPFATHESAYSALLVLASKVPASMRSRVEFSVVTITTTVQPSR